MKTEELLQELFVGEGGRLDGRPTGAIDPGAAMARLLTFVFDGSSPTSAWLRAGFVKWFEEGHTLSLERCLHLPSTPAKRQQAIRDYWLADASNYVRASTARQVGISLNREMTAFVTRGNWRRWRDDAEPPVDAPRLDRALFYAVKFNRGEVLSARQLARIIGHKFTK